LQAYWAAELPQRSNYGNGGIAGDLTDTELITTVNRMQESATKITTTAARTGTGESMI
jgi:hypothetical protein